VYLEISLDIGPDVLYDLCLYEVELMLSEGFSMLYESLSLLLRDQFEKRVLLDYLGVLFLALYEIFDDWCAISSV